MNLVVNGKVMTCADSLTVRGLLAELGLSANAIVVELNAAVLQRSAYAITLLSEGDSLELIQVVGGG